MTSTYCRFGNLPASIAIANASISALVTLHRLIFSLARLVCTCSVSRCSELLISFPLTSSSSTPGSDEEHVESRLNSRAIFGVTHPTPLLSLNRKCMGYPGKKIFLIYPIILPSVTTRVSSQQCSVLSTTLNYCLFLPVSGTESINFIMFMRPIISTNILYMSHLSSY